MKSIEERLKKAALGAGCLFLALGAFEMQSHAADAASQVQSRALLVTRGDYEGTVQGYVYFQRIYREACK